MEGLLWLTDSDHVQPGAAAMFLSRVAAGEEPRSPPTAQNTLDTWWNSDIKEIRGGSLLGQQDGRMSKAAAKPENVGGIPRTHRVIEKTNSWKLS